MTITQALWLYQQLLNAQSTYGTHAQLKETLVRAESTDCV